MACWVVPAIAAEFWGVSVDHVMSQIQDGHVPTKSEQGFVFVDVAPNSESVHSRAPQDPRETYRVVTPDELAALHPNVVEADFLQAFSASNDAIASDDGDDGTEMSEAELDPAAELDRPSPGAVPGWQRVRAIVGQTRRPPLAA